MTAAPFRRTLSGWTLIAAFAAVHAAGAQAPAGGGGRQKLTFIAIGSDGQPVADLKPEQVELKIDGKVRAMQSLTLVKLGGTTGPAAPKAIFDTPVPPPYGSNAVAPSRSVLLIIDEPSMRPGSDKPLKDGIEQFLGTLGPADRLGLLTMPQGTVKVDPTTNRTAVKEALMNVGGRLAPTRDEEVDACHARDLLQALAGTLLALGEGPTTVVLFSSGIGSPSTATSGSTCTVTTTEFQKVGQAANAARATVYIVQPETVTAARDLGGLRDLAGSVTSPLLNLANTTDGALARVLRESAAYYLAEIDVDVAERDGRAHRLDLKVNAPGASVRVPTEIMFARTDPRANKPSPKDFVKETKIYTDLPLRVVGYTSKGAAEKMRVLAVVEPLDPAVKFAAVSIGLADSANKMTTWSASAEDLAKPVMLAAIDVAPGNYRLHVAAVDVSGRAGSASYQVEAQLTNVGPMRMSGLALMSSAMAPKLEFKDDTEVIAYFELYGTTSGGIGATVELAETPDGPALKTATLSPEPLNPAQLAAGQLKLGGAQEKEKYLAAAKLDIADLKPGDYVVRASFQLEGTPASKIFRTLRKVAK